LVSFSISVLHTVFPVIPFFIICGANGIIFGFWPGLLITWAGSLTGASIKFFAARKLGYEWVAGRSKEGHLSQVEQMSGPHGFMVILFLRLLPYVPAPAINILAGVSSIRFPVFLAASALGKLPFIAGYTYAGYSLINSKQYTHALYLVVGIMIISYGLILIFKRRRTGDRQVN
jgi:uncharacterized membrane protein YdjX (TVP38/TMEM64 family)